MNNDIADWTATDDDRRRLLTLTASGVSTAVALGALGGATRAFAAADTRALGVAARDGRGARRLSLLGRQEIRLFRRHRRRRLSPGLRMRPQRSSSSTRTRPTWAIPRPAFSRSRLSRASRSCRYSRWAAATCSTSHSARARSRSRVKDLEGKTILLGSAGWQSICDPHARCGGRRHQDDQVCRGGLADLGHSAQGRQGRRGAVLGGPARPVERARGSISTISSARTIPSCRPTASSSARRTSRIRPRRSSTRVISRAGRRASSSASRTRAPRRRS